MCFSFFLNNTLFLVFSKHGVCSLNLACDKALGFKCTFFKGPNFFNRIIVIIGVFRQTLFFQNPYVFYVQYGYF